MKLNFIGKINSLAVNNNKLAFAYNDGRADFYFYSDNVTIKDSQIQVNRINFNLSEMQPKTTLTLSINNDRVISDNQDFMIIDLFFDKAFIVISKKPELDVEGDFELVENDERTLKIGYSSNKATNITFEIEKTASTARFPQIIDIWVIGYDLQKESVLKWIFDNVAI